MITIIEIAGKVAERVEKGKNLQIERYIGIIRRESLTQKATEHLPAPELAAGGRS